MAAEKRFGLGLCKLSTLLLAKEIGADLVILDDFGVRKLAQREGLPVSKATSKLHPHSKGDRSRWNKKEDTNQHFDLISQLPNWRYLAAFGGISTDGRPDALVVQVQPEGTPNSALRPGD